ncbi:MAG: sigma 54-interacting transcriptional regulator [Rhodothermales bacterium]
MDRQAVQERFGIIGSSDPLKRVIDRVRQVAQTDITVLLEGESGVGKELFANAIHGLSRRRHKPLVVVNCGAIPEGLIEAELFGAEKGAYTGSVERRTGYFEEADGGTVFLDEIGELPVQAQVRLLRVLENGTFSRVGSSQQQQVDVRVIAATNKDLGREVRDGRFREDLYYRLSTVVIRVPPVRNRPEDILPLFEHFLYRAAQKYDAPLRRLDAAARDLLSRYNWPGNVREMRNVAEQAAVLLRSDTASVDDIRPFLRGVSAAQGLTLAAKALPDGVDSQERELVYRALVELRAEMREVKELLGRIAGGASLHASPFASLPGFPAVAFEEGAFDSLTRRSDEPAFAFVPDANEAGYDGPFEDVPYEIEEDPDDEPEDPPLALPADGTALRLGDGPLPTMEEVEQTLIAEALRRFDGNRRQTAKALGISERTLYRKIKDLEEQGVEV